MSTSTDTITSLVQSEYKYGFYMDIETESAPPGITSPSTPRWTAKSCRN